MEYNCPKCGSKTESDYRFCPCCSKEINPINTSGQGFSATVPSELLGWNWGAFFLTWIWGIFHQVWLSLLVLIPLGNIVMPFVLGVKGNEWAWQSKKWDSIEQFRHTQHTWMIWGIIAFVAPLVLILGLLLITLGILGYYGFFTLQ
jgi:hypothetical protein